MAEKRSLQYETANTASRGKDYQARAWAFSEEYKKFLSSGKTERQCVAEAIRLAESKGFRPYTMGEPIHAGDKIYYVNCNHSVLLADVKEDVERGVNLAVAHIDSPRIDLKPNPVYEDGELGFFRTHYYGGMKKYQWPSVPLALIGTVVRENGEHVDISIGDEPGDPVFCIPDLLPHLEDRDKKTLSESFRGETFNTLAASLPAEDCEKDPVAEAMLALLKEKYDISAEDLISAELTLVPAGAPRDLGLDRSMILAYGHDDKVCAYPSLAAFLEGGYEKTAVIALADKEEIGSDGVTGLDADWLHDFLYEIALGAGADPRKMIANSMCLSADVSAAFDPTYAQVFEKKNSAYLSHGVAVLKYTGHGGKYSTSDAPAEVMAQMRRIFNGALVPWQSAELGKVDAGGGGTLAKYVAKLGIRVLDVGVPVLSMHAPFEVVSKLDVYAMYEAAKAFLKNAEG